MYIWVADWSDEGEGGRFVWISIGDCDVEFPEAIFLFLLFCFLSVQEFNKRLVVVDDYLL
jgi:hypothetical protein